MKNENEKYKKFLEILDGDEDYTDSGISAKEYNTFRTRLLNEMDEEDRINDERERRKELILSRNDKLRAIENKLHNEEDYVEFKDWEDFKEK